MKSPKHFLQRGFLLLELALALVIVGGLMAVLLPLLAMQSKFDEVNRDQQAMQTAAEALLRQTVVAGGLPAPLQLKEGDVAGGTASSHLELADPQTALPPGWAGALPGTALGVGTTSPLQTAYWYDAHAALRADSELAFQIKVQTTDSGWGFLPLEQQLDPDLNANVTTGGSTTQLCRHVNTLLALDNRVRLGSAGFNRNLINVTLPRVWAGGYENRFSWNAELGYAVTDAANVDSVFENSSAAAFVVVRRQPPALRRLDRQNAVYEQFMTTGLDKALASRGSLAYPGETTGGARGFRVYENPLTRSSDHPSNDTNDYDGLVRAVTLHELAERLRDAGLCTTAAATCQAHQLWVRFGNYVQSLPTSGSPQGLTMRWELLDRDPLTDAYTVIQSDDVDSGQSSGGICLDGFAADVANQPNTRYLRLSFISPTGRVGYSSGNYWFRGGIWVDPDGTDPVADNGINRWRNRSALSATQAGQTVSIRCTGSQSLDSSQELTTSTEPTCAITQSP